MDSDQASGKGTLFCTFCGKSQHEVMKLIAGPNVFICDECVVLCSEILEGKATTDVTTDATPDIPPEVIITPQDIYSHLSRFVIGQEYAKQALAVAIYIHLQRSQSPKDFPLRKSNILMIGPTGVGKTYLAKTLAGLLRAPYVILSATAYTEAGYVGEDVEHMIRLLLWASKNNVNLAQNGIIFIDEIDKLARASGRSTTIGRDVSGIGVQQSLLTLLEGSKISVPPFGKRKQEDTEPTEVDTRNILFICAGAFVGIEKIVDSRLTASSSLFLPVNKTPGHGADTDYGLYNQLMSRVISEDIVEFGFIPEFVGRLNSVVTLSPMKKDTLIDILIKSDGSVLRDYTAYFQRHGVDLKFTDDAISTTAELALSLRTGARALHAVIEKTLVHALYALPSRKAIKTLVVDRDVVRGIKQPEIYATADRPLRWRRDSVFIGYSRKDVRLFDELNAVLAPLGTFSKIKIWSDESITAGQEWKKEIRNALASARVAVFLVSAEFLASEYAIKEELEYFISIQEEENVTIVWALLGPCLHEETPISKFQAIHDVGKPLSRVDKHDRQEIWMDVAKEIKKRFEEIEDGGGRTSG